MFSFFQCRFPVYVNRLNILNSVPLMGLVFRCIFVIFVFANTSANAHGFFRSLLGFPSAISIIFNTCWWYEFSYNCKGVSRQYSQCVGVPLVVLSVQWLIFSDLLFSTRGHPGPATVLRVIVSLFIEFLFSKGSMRFVFCIRIVAILAQGSWWLREEV